MLEKLLKAKFKVLLICILGLSCNNKLSNNVSIEKFTPISEIDSTIDRGKILYFKHENFIIHNFRRNNAMKKFVDEYVEKIKGNSPLKYNQYNILFYKHSSITNVKHLKSNPRDLYRYSQEHDAVYLYVFINNKKSFYEYKNGKMMNPENEVIVED